MTETTHKLSWFVKADGNSEWMPRTSSLRGRWNYDAKCSCGWESRTGGGTYSSVRQMVADHKHEAAREASRGL